MTSLFYFSVLRLLCSCKGIIRLETSGSTYENNHFVKTICDSEEDFQEVANFNVLQHPPNITGINVPPMRHHECRSRCISDISCFAYVWFYESENEDPNCFMSSEVISYESAFQYSGSHHGYVTGICTSEPIGLF